MTAVCCTQVFFPECAFALGSNTLVALPPCKQDNGFTSGVICFCFGGRQDESYHQIYLESYHWIYLITKSNGIFCAISNLM